MTLGYFSLCNNAFFLSVIIYNANTTKSVVIEGSVAKQCLSSFMLRDFISLVPYVVTVDFSLLTIVILRVNIYSVPLGPAQQAGEISVASLVVDENVELGKLGGAAVGTGIWPLHNLPSPDCFGMA